MRSDPSTNDDRTGECSTVILSDDALHAACRRLTSAVLRRWALIATVEATGFTKADLDDPELVRCWRLARDTQNSVAIRGMLADDAFLRNLFSNPVVELDSRAATTLARQIMRSRRHQGGRYLKLPAIND